MVSSKHCAILALALLLPAAPSRAQSLRSVESAAGGFEHARLGSIPPSFGTGEFTFELWIRPDVAFPVGDCGSESERLRNWCTQNNLPYPDSSWWFDGNFMLDGHNNGGFPNGTFTLQFYGGGRLRWLFGDGEDTITAASHWSVGDGRAVNAPALLDGNWHQVTLVRRWTGTTQALLELWIDGALIHSETSDRRTNMRQWWDGYPADGPSQGGWFLLAEKQVAENRFDVIEDYKGWIDELRFWARAKPAGEIASDWDAPVTGTEPGLVGWFDFSDVNAASTQSCDRLATSRCMQLVPRGARSARSADNAPLGGAGVAILADGFE
jgi:hypothetical protein